MVTCTPEGCTSWTPSPWLIVVRFGFGIAIGFIVYFLLRRFWSTRWYWHVLCAVIAATLAFAIFVAFTIRA